MLARKNRFHGHSAVRRVYRLGKPTRTAVLSLHALRNDHVKATKFAVVVSKKVHKSAVKRNRIRRRVYEVIRQNLSLIQTPTEVVVTVYSPDLADLPAEELKKAVDQIIKKSRILS